MNKLRLLHIPILIAAIFMGLGFYVKVEAAKAPKQVFIFEEITLSGKSKIDRFMERYKTRLFTFMAKQPETSRQEITDGLIESVNYGFSSENFKGNKVLVGLNKKHPEQPVILSHLASSFFVLGIHPSIKEDEDRQAYYLREALNASKGCLDSLAAGKTQKNIGPGNSCDFGH